MSASSRERAPRFAARARRRPAVLVEVEGGVDCGHGHADRVFADQRNRIARLDIAFFADAEVESAAVGAQEGFVETADAHFVRQLVTGDAWLRHLDDRPADAKDIADADLVFQQPLQW